jgi:hypothetical protein
MNSHEKLLLQGVFKKRLLSGDGRAIPLLGLRGVVSSLAINLHVYGAKNFWTRFFRRQKSVNKVAAQWKLEELRALVGLTR